MNIFYRGVTHLTRLSTVTLVGGNSLWDAARKMIPFCSSKLIFQSSFSSGCQSSFPYGSSLLSRQLTLPGVPQIKERPMLSSNTLYNISKRMASLEYMHRRGKPLKIKRKKKNPLGFGIPFAKGVVLKTLIRKPKKPNSANRKCVLVRLSSGKEMIAFVPGEGHNLQEHSVVLVRPGRLRDTPGVKIRCIRGKYDLPHVVKKKA